MAGTARGKRYVEAILAVTIFAASMLALLSAAPASAMETFEVEEYQRDFNVTQEKAENILEVQDRGAGIVSQLERALGKSYAGVWFDNESGEFVVPLTRDVSRAVVVPAFKRNELQGDYRTENARFSWATLNAVQAQLDDALRSQLTDGLVATSVDARANAVIVHQAQTAGKVARAEIHSDAAEFGAKAQVQVAATEGLGVDPMSCAWESGAACDPPFRAGTGIFQRKESVTTESCTGAFKAYGDDGDRYVLTAGHCGPVGSVWQSRNSSAPWLNFYAELGTTAQRKYDSGSDWAKINVSGSSYWDVTPWPAGVVIWQKNPDPEGEDQDPDPAVDENYPIYGTGASYEGMYVCHSGLITGTSCGPVTDLDKTVEASAGGYVHHLTEFGPACGFGGDSGGPAFIGNLAYGIYVGGDSEYPQCKRPNYYYEIAMVTDDLDVEVANGTEPALPLHSNDEEDHSPGPRTIVEPNKTVHTFYRTPTGGLGHNWHVPWESGWGSETLTGSVASEPHAVVDKDGGINVFYRTPSGGLGHNWWEVGGSSWGQETLSGSLASEPRAIVEPNKTVHVFYKTPSGGLGHNWHVPWESGWGSETLSGSLASDPRAVVDKDGGINVFYRTPSGGLGHNWWEVGGSSWDQETLSGSLASEPRAIVEPNKTVHVFYRTPTGGLGHNWHVPWESGWGSETLSGSVASEPHAVVDDDGGINVFYRTPSGGLGHNWWEVGGSSWGSETLSGSLASEPHPIVHYDNTVSVFYRTPSGGLGHNWHVPWESGWGSETLSGSVASEPHPIVDNDGGVNVFYRTPSGGLGHNWFEVGGSSWGSETLAGSVAGPPFSPVVAVVAPDGKMSAKVDSVFGIWVDQSISGVKIVDASVASDPNNGPVLVALGENGHVYAKQGLYGAWVHQTGEALAISVGSDATRGPIIGVLLKDGRAFAREGSLTASWVELTGGSSQAISVSNDATRGPIIGVLQTNGAVYAKEGSLTASWVQQTGGSSQAISVANDATRGPIMGVLQTNGTAYAKEGSLTASWVEQMAGSTAVSVENDATRGAIIGVRHSNGKVFAKEGSLSASWVEVTGSGQTVSVSNDSPKGALLGVLNEGHAVIKEGSLGSAWVEVSAGIADLAIAG